MIYFRFGGIFQMNVWSANNEVFSLVDKIKNLHHHPRLQLATVAVEFNDGKPFIRDRFNWGKVSKFSASAKLWMPKDKRYDFLISLPGDGWNGVLNAEQREAWLDLHLACCSAEYKPMVVEENGKKKPVKDDFGRIQYSDEMRFDDMGNPKWKKLPLDLNTFQDNVQRYGCWSQDLLDFRSVLNEEDKRKETFVIT